MSAYYNEIEPYAAQWLRNLINAGLIADGEVDTRSITDVVPSDIDKFTQCHFFAGIAGWSHALRLAGWADDRKIWTGSCPCQPFSVAGKGKGTDDERHLWPHFFRLIRGCRPPVVMGEQVAGAAGYGWLDGVRSDLESEGYAIEGVDIPACSANAPHIRSRLYWVANTNSRGCESAGKRRSLDAIHARELHDGMPITERDTCGNNFGNAESKGLEGHSGVLSDRDQSRRLHTQQDGQTMRPGSRDMANAESLRRGGWTDNEDGWWRQLASSNSCARSDMANASISGWRQGSKNAGRVFEGNRTEGEAGRFTKHGDTFDMANADTMRELQSQGSISNERGWTGDTSFWNNAIWLNGADGKTRRAEPSIRLLAHGVPARVGKLRAYGNAIVPPLAAEVIKAFMEVRP